VLVTNVPAYGTRSVAQHTFALLARTHAARRDITRRPCGKVAGCARRTGVTGSARCRTGGLTLGIVGYGRIGQAVAGLAAAFGMSVIASVSSSGKKPEANVAVVDLDGLSARAMW